MRQGLCYAHGERVRPPGKLSPGGPFVIVEEVVTVARASTVCAVPGCPHPSHARGYCRTHASISDKRQRATVPTKILGARTEERRRRARAVESWRQRFGNVCPGYGRPPHPAADLTAQHSHALVLGGEVDQPLTVLCRSCNSRHGLEARHRQRDRRFAGVGETP